jgi:hypothetical protein
MNLPRPLTRLNGLITGSPMALSNSKCKPIFRAQNSYSGRSNQRRTASLRSESRSELGKRAKYSPIGVAAKSLRSGIFSASLGVYQFNYAFINFTRYSLRQSQ